VARDEAQRLCGPLAGRPFLVTDNGPSFMARRFARYTREAFRHVRIQYRTPTQLGLLGRTLKEEEIYWRLYDGPAHCRACLEEFRERYNTRRPHWALVPEEGGDPLVPLEVFGGDRAVRIPRWQPWARGAKARLDELLAEAA
jgi:transposase InsO family protein